ncbi:DUF554 domain-containing protein [Treponema sp.]|uniref:DUF554 domain-containing protein n=1 Tax=Treponema sp. TaxID=166 RepID=UPI00298EA06A|nr:DUF554 domain-containing protein [Treponema sp.]MCQ2241063.1 DUF554 domain-containing protein [Treponema sp.]
MLAVFVNCAAVVLGSLIGLVVAGRMSKKMEDVIQTGAGFITLVIGMQMAFKYQNVCFLTLAIIAGGIIGTIIDLDDKILSLGKLLERLLPKKRPEGQETELSVNKNFAYAFLNASVLFCVGAMAILGSFKAGIEKDYSIIFTKSILDGFMAISFTAAMGIGTAFSAIAIFLYQGALTLLSVAVQPYVSDVMLAELTGSGGVLICMIGINLIGLKKIKTANYLPAVIFTVLFVLLDSPVRNLLGM